MRCKICDKKAKSIFDAKILNKYSIKYFHCNFCGFLQTEKPYWITESYANVITNNDIGLISRNLNLAEITKVLIFSLYSNNSHTDLGLLSNKIFKKFIKILKLERIFTRQKFKKIYASGFDFKQKFIDYGGGYGIFVRLMRDTGLDFYWHDTHCQNLFARKFEADLNRNYKLLTAFEVLEHLPDPVRELEKIFKISSNILFSTELLPDNKLPAPEDWWYYGLEHGQHISFYSKKTLEYITDMYKLNLYSNNQAVHFFTKENINLKFIKLLFKNTGRLSKLIDKTSKPRSLLEKDFKKLTGRDLI
ncbi:MAG: class I SAM-dependent methyltransferase [Promethearchaeota archaeon]